MAEPHLIGRRPCFAPPMVPAGVGSSKVPSIGRFLHWGALEARTKLSPPGEELGNRGGKRGFSAGSPREPWWSQVGQLCSPHFKAESYVLFLSSMAGSTLSQGQKTLGGRSQAFTGDAGD